MTFRPLTDNRLEVQGWGILSANSGVALLLSATSGVALFRGLSATSGVVSSPSFCLQLLGWFGPRPLLVCNFRGGGGCQQLQGWRVPSIVCNFGGGLSEKAA